MHARGVGPAPIPVDEFSLEKLVDAIRFMLDPKVFAIFFINTVGAIDLSFPMGVNFSHMQHIEYLMPGIWDIANGNNFYQLQVVFPHNMR